MRTTRRDLFRGLGAGALLAGPWLRASRAAAQGPRAGGNFLFFFTPNGFVRRAFGSDGNDATFRLRPGLAPAESMKAHLSVVRGLSWKSQQASRPFHDQLPNLLSCVSGPDRQRSYGPTLDHVVGRLIDTPPLTTQVYVYSDPAFFMRLSWKQSGVHEPPVRSPMEAYDAAFGKMVPSGNAAELEQAIAQELSVLDFLREDLSLFRGRLPGSERGRLDAHLDALREVERRLSGTVAAGKCAPAAAAATVGRRGSAGDRDEFKRHGELTADVIAAAFACGLRNATTMFWQTPGGGMNPNKGLTGKAAVHHHVSHNEAPEQVWIDIDRWYAGAFADTLRRLEAQGVLDRTVVVWGTEIAQGHSHNNCTIVVGGGRALGIRHGKTLEFPFHGGEGGALAAARDPRNASLSDLWLTVLKACGSKDERFGEHSTGGIPGLWAPT